MPLKLKRKSIEKSYKKYNKTSLHQWQKVIPRNGDVSAIKGRDGWGNKGMKNARKNGCVCVSECKCYERKKENSHECWMFGAWLHSCCWLKIRSYAYDLCISRSASITAAPSICMLTIALTVCAMRPSVDDSVDVCALYVVFWIVC